MFDITNFILWEGPIAFVIQTLRNKYPQNPKKGEEERTRNS